MKKKIISLVLSVALILYAVAIPAAASEAVYTEYLLGDADGNDKVDTIDATYVQRSCAEIKVRIKHRVLMHGDVDRNGELEITDATYIQRYLAMFPIPFPIGTYVEEPLLDTKFTVDNITATAGETVNVAVNIDGNPGILGMTFAVSYDSSVMTLTDAVSGNAVSDVLAFTKPGSFNSPCNFTWDGIDISDDEINDGMILNLTFEVSPDASVGVYPITLSYEADSIFDKYLDSIEPDVIDGSITVYEPTQPTVQPTVTPITDTTIEVENVLSEPGDLFDVVVSIKDNPGILGMTLTLSYDSSKLNLISAMSGEVFSDVLTFTKPGKFQSPCNFTWDGIELSDGVIADGEILILTFTVPEDTPAGVYPLTLTYEKDGIFNKDLIPVEPQIINGSVTIKDAPVKPTDPVQPTEAPTVEPTTETPTEPPTIAPVSSAEIEVGKVTAAKGETISVPVTVKDNPGILGMTLTLSYDSSKLTLTDAVSGSAVSDGLAFTKPGRFTSPCNFTWDGIELSEDQIKDGDILNLTFTVASNAPDGVYPITLSYDEGDIIDKNLVMINPVIVNGSITVNSTPVEPTTPVTPTEQPTEAPTEPPVTGTAVKADKVEAAPGETVNVAVNIKDNPGILGMTLTLSYDADALTLTNAASGSAFSDVLAFTKPGRFTSPCNFTWDGIELSEDQIKDGEILILTFLVSENAEPGKSYPITLTYDKDSIIGADLNPVDITVVNGSVSVSG